MPKSLPQCIRRPIRCKGEIPPIFLTIFGGRTAVKKPGFLVNIISSLLELKSLASGGEKPGFWQRKRRPPVYFPVAAQEMVY
jgi:hypothetical protein